MLLRGDQLWTRKLQALVISGRRAYHIMLFVIFFLLLELELTFKIFAKVKNIMFKYCVVEYY